MRVAIGMPYPMVMNAVRLSVRIGRVDRMDTEQTFNAADDAANRAADDRANRPSCVHANGTAVGDSVRNALRISCKRQCERRGGNGSTKDVRLHRGTFPLLESQEVAAKQGVGVAMELRNAAMRRSASAIKGECGKAATLGWHGTSLEASNGRSFRSAL